MAKKQLLPQIHQLYLIIAALVIVVAGLLVALSQAQNKASASELIANKQVSPKECDKKGSPVINVTQKIVNSIDSGVAGNYWAYVNFNRKIQVWQSTNGKYCALVDYDGKFDAQTGQNSPGNTGVLTGSEDGNFKGGYRAVITGNLKASPDLPTKGSIGTTDYQCDLSGNCPGAFDWTTKYFVTGTTGYTFNYSWWGWEYHTTGKKIWINSSDGNSGDII